MSWEWNSQFCLNLSRNFCSYKNSLNIDLYTFFRNLKHVVSKYTYRRVHKDLKIVHDWRSQSLYLIPRNINQLNKPDNHRAPLVWENVLVLAGLDMRERQTGLNHLSNLGPAASFPSLCATGPLFCKFNNFDGKTGVGLLILVRTKWTEGAVTCWASWAVWRGFKSTVNYKM